MKKNAKLSRRIAGVACGLLAVAATSAAMAGGLPTQPPAAQELLVQASTTPATASTGDEVLDILLAIGMIDARMQAGMVLYQAKDRKGAIQHFRFARDKVYKPMAPQLVARELPPFDEGIRALELASSPGQVLGAYLAVTKGLTMARGGIEATPKQQLLAIELQTALAAEALGKGVKDGKVKNAEAYQDAWGMILSARTALGPLEGSADPALGTPVGAVGTVLDNLIIAMPDALAQGEVEIDQEAVLAAAAEIKTIVAAVQ